MTTVIQILETIKQKVQVIAKHLRFDKLLAKTGRKLALAIPEVIALGLFKQKQYIQTKKSLHEITRPSCSYKTLVVNLNRFAPLAALVLRLLLQFNRTRQHLIKHTDTTDTPVCRSKNARYHKTMKDYARWGHNGQDYYFGLKMHLTADLDGNLLAVKFTSANVDDRAMLLPLNEDILGIFVADAGYVSSELERAFSIDWRRILLTKCRKNMKKLATLFDVWAYSTRMRIEQPIRELKLFCGLVTSLPRSVAGYLANYTYSLLAYLLA